MHLLINDFGRYSFTMQLARELGQRGLMVGYSYCEKLSATPEGNVQIGHEESGFLRGLPVRLNHDLDKKNLWKRRKQEIEYGKRLAEIVRSEQPSVVLSANTPLDAQRQIWQVAGSLGLKRVFWLQDLIGVATRKLLARKLPVLGHWVGSHYLRLERRLLHEADEIVAISPGFEPILNDWGIASSKLRVIENWAPLNEIVPGPRKNEWSRERSLNESFVFTYSGTLSLKHNPTVLLDLAKSIAPYGGVVVVRSQGIGIDWLKEKTRSRPLNNLLLEGYGSYADLPTALAGSDVLVALLEPEAAEFSVPSKVATYLCAGRAVLAVMPRDNPAAQQVLRSNSGRVCQTLESVSKQAVEMVRSKSEVAVMGTNARKEAERAFDIGQIASQFESIVV